MKTVFILALCVAAALAKPAGKQRRELMNVERLLEPCDLEPKPRRDRLPSQISMLGKTAALEWDLLDLLNRALMRSDVAREEEVEKKEVVENRDDEKTRILSVISQLIEFVVGYNFWPQTSADEFYTDISDGIDCKVRVTTREMHRKILEGLHRLLSIAVINTLATPAEACTFESQVNDALQRCVGPEVLGVEKD